MGKKVNKKEEKNIKKEIDNKSVSSEAKQLLIVTIVVLLFLGAFYLLTVFILDDDTEDKESDIEEVEIQFDEILLGTSFSLRDDEYYVLYYETDDEEINSDLSSLVYTYRSSNAEPYLYTVDMSDALNASFSNEESNEKAAKASELKISGPTLIKFVDGKINKYVDGIDEITEILE